MAEPMNPHDVPPPPRPGMSSTVKVLLVLGLSCSLLVLVCCGGLAGLSYWFVSAQKVSTTPEAVRDLTASIVTITVPASLKPKMAIEGRLPFTDKWGMNIVVYQDAAEDSTLAIVQIMGVTEKDIKQTRTEFNDAMKSHGGDEQEELHVIETEDFDAEIHLEPAHFKIVRGTGEKSQEEYWDVVGQFHGDGGVAVLILRAKASEFTKDDILGILKSMK